jgi:sugar phosphate isomerase/epimerase
MKGISRRARACAVLATAGVVVLSSASAASAQRPVKVGDGVPTGQGSVQMFNYGNFISVGGNTGDASPITNIANASNGAQCATSIATSNPNANPPIVADPPEQLAECRRNRVEALFAFLQSKGVTSIEMFGHAGFPAPTDVAGNQAYRALLDKYGLHAAGQHGTLTAEVNQTWRDRVAAGKILGADALGSGGYGSPGIGSYANTLQTAKNLNTIGKYSVEQGVGPVYVHNHTAEFDNKYMHNGELKSAVEIIAEETDPRYVFLEIDVFWSSDAFDDETGQQTAALINKYPDRIKMLHVKDGINVAARASETNSRGGSPRAFGTGVVDFRPIFAAAKNRVQYYHQEHDGGTITDAGISLTNLKGINSQSMPALMGYPGTAPAVPANAASQFKVNVENTGDKPLTITGATITGDNAGDFSIADNGCVTTLANGVLATETAPAVTRGKCEVTVNYKAATIGKQSVAYLQFASNADDATEKVLLTGSTTNASVTASTVGGSVGATLSLTLGAPAAFGGFTPGVARVYEANQTANVISTAGNATLTVSDASATANGHLVNGTFSLPQPLKAAGSVLPATVKTYDTPVSNDAVTIPFTQEIAANDALRTGTYSKTLTFTLSTTAP